MFRTAFDELSIDVIPQVIYNFYNTDKLKLFIGVGATLNFANFSNEHYGPKDNNPAYNDAIDNVFYFNKFDNTALLKAGVQVGKRWSVYGNYYLGISTTKAGYFDLTSNVTQVGLTYSFN